MTDPHTLDLPALAALGIDAAMIEQRVRLDGEPALEFLAELPGLVADWSSRLGLRDAVLLPGGVLSAALACRVGSEPVVLKLSAAHAASARAEAAALARWEGQGACRLRFTACDGRVMLLDAIRPGSAVRPEGETEDAQRAAALLRLLHRRGPFPPEVPDASDELNWRFSRARTQLDGPSRGRDLVDHDDVEAALRAALALHAQRGQTVLCHGDFLPKNILLDEGGEWRAIDPRPCCGDPCLDVAFWALAHEDGAGAWSRCRRVSKAAGLDADRVWRWMRVFAVSEAVLVTDVRRARAFHSVLSQRTSVCTR